MAPEAGLEPATTALTVRDSTIELFRNLECEIPKAKAVGLQRFIDTAHAAASPPFCLSSECSPHPDAVCKSVCKIAYVVLFVNWCSLTTTINGLGLCSRFIINNHLVCGIFINLLNERVRTIILRASLDLASPQTMRKH